MIVDGKKIATEIYERTRARAQACSHPPRLAILTCNPNLSTKKYLALKQKKAEEVGILTEVIELPGTTTTDDFVSMIETCAQRADGVIVQLPLPKHVDTDRVLSAIPVEQDVDALNPHTTAFLSPVVGAIAAILGAHNVVVPGTFVTVIGSGKLVGLPAYAWFMEQGAHVSVVTKDVSDIEQYTKNADIIVCGAGVAGLLTPELIKDGVIILDAGTSEDGGELRGDADPRCSDKASLFTPVPGGIGPVTVAILLRNVVHCAERGEAVV